MGKKLLNIDVSATMLVLVIKTRLGVINYFSEEINDTKFIGEIKCELVKKARLKQMKVKHEFLVIPSSIKGNLQEHINKLTAEW